ncbi:hypothetical protein E2C01_058934 [Portunus trituberculatus]|uniref:Uncharacterized protein n=1 Tax=Portunus trituberculatus TaxID=210409 RepID=A0A5B7H423_PORTR|nr:hypothetical protein [Portunus trituberculatus]
MEGGRSKTKIRVKHSLMDPGEVKGFIHCKRLRDVEDEGINRKNKGEMLLGGSRLFKTPRSVKNG